MMLPFLHDGLVLSVLAAAGAAQQDTCTTDCTQAQECAAPEARAELTAAPAQDGQDEITDEVERILSLDLAELDGEIRRLEAAAPQSVRLAPVGDQENGFLGVYLGDEEQATITGFVDGGPAAQSGFRAGDRILAIGDRKVGSRAELLERMKGTRPGQTVAVKIARGDAVEVVEVTLGNRSGSVPAPDTADEPVAIEQVVVEAAPGAKDAPAGGFFVVEDHDEDVSEEVDVEVTEVDADGNVRIRVGGRDVELGEHEGVHRFRFGDGGEGQVLVVRGDGDGVPHAVEIEAVHGHDAHQHEAHEHDAHEHDAHEHDAHEHDADEHDAHEESKADRWIVVRGGDGGAKELHEHLVELHGGAEHGLLEISVEGDVDAKKLHEHVIELHGGPQGLFVVGKGGEDGKSVRRHVVRSDGEHGVHRVHLDRLHAHLGELHGEDGRRVRIVTPEGAGGAWVRKGGDGGVHVHGGFVRERDDDGGHGSFEREIDELREEVDRLREQVDDLSAALRRSNRARTERADVRGLRGDIRRLLEALERSDR